MLYIPHLSFCMSTRFILSSFAAIKHGAAKGPWCDLTWHVPSMTAAPVRGCRGVGGQGVGRPKAVCSAHVAAHITARGLTGHLVGHGHGCVCVCVSVCVCVCVCTCCVHTRAHRFASVCSSLSARAGEQLTLCCIAGVRSKGNSTTRRRGRHVALLLLLPSCSGRWCL